MRTAVRRICGQLLLPITLGHTASTYIHECTQLIGGSACGHVNKLRLPNKVSRATELRSVHTWNKHQDLRIVAGIVAGKQLWTRIRMLNLN